MLSSVLAKQNITLRGSNHDEGNYIEMLKLQSLYVDEIKEWLQKINTNKIIMLSYTGKYSIKY